MSAGTYPDLAPLSEILLQTSDFLTSCEQLCAHLESQPLHQLPQASLETQLPPLIAAKAALIRAWHSAFPKATLSDLLTRTPTHLSADLAASGRLLRARSERLRRKLLLFLHHSAQHSRWLRQLIQSLTASSDSVTYGASGTITGAPLPLRTGSRA